MTQTSKPAPYRVRPADLDTEASLIQALWSQNFVALNEKTGAAKFDAQYRHNPAGKGECLFLEEQASATVIGVQGLIRRRFVHGADLLVAGVMADYAVNAPHRSLGPALQLMKSCIAHGRQTLDFLYGFPNPRSQAIFQRAGLLPTGTISRYVKPLRSREFLTRSLSARWRVVLPVLTVLVDVAMRLGETWRQLRYGQQWQWRQCEHFDEEFDRSWLGGERGNMVMGERSRDMLAWRYPNPAMRRIAVVRDPKNGEPVGHVIWQRNGLMLSILDVYCRRPDHQLLGLLCGFSRQVRHLPATSLSMEFKGPANLRLALKRAGFHPREDCPFHAILGEASSIGELDAEVFYLTSFDRDSD